MTDSKTSTSGTAQPTASDSAFDLSEIFAMYDPQKIAQMFDPSKLFGQRPGMGGGDFDIEALMKKNQASFDAMVEANKAAAETYKDMLQKQMEIFNRLSTEAQTLATEMKNPVDPDAARTNARIHADAAEKAFALMRDMAEAAQQANQAAFDRLSGQLTAAIDELRTG